MVDIIVTFHRKGTRIYSRNHKPQTTHPPITLSKRYSNQTALQSSRFPVPPSFYQSIAAFADNTPNRLKAPDLVERGNDTRLVHVAPHTSHLASLALRFVVSPRDVDLELLLPGPTEQTELCYSTAIFVISTSGPRDSVEDVTGSVGDVHGGNRRVEDEAAVLRFAATEGNLSSALGC